MISVQSYQFTAFTVDVRYCLVYWVDHEKDIKFRLLVF